MQLKFNEKKEEKGTTIKQAWKKEHLSFFIQLEMKW